MAKFFLDSLNRWTGLAMSIVGTICNIKKELALPLSLV
jgi:hypothetical protein